MNLRVALTGDVMTGRGLDQAFAVTAPPDLYEPYVRDARGYLALAERENGGIPRPIASDYPWGDALSVLEGAGCDLRLINLETAVTQRGEPWPGKGVHYRMHPANVACIGALGPDIASLANNHVLDWGRGGLADTREAVRAAGVVSAGAGDDMHTAAAPATHATRAGTRVAVFAACLADSGVPHDWAAGADRAGVHLLDGPDGAGAVALTEAIAGTREGGAHVIVSLHWGGNWGYDVPQAHRMLAHRLIDAGADLVHGHSSHHPKGAECYRGRLVLYGCGDFFNDYEGIDGHAGYRPELALLYVADLDARGALCALDAHVFRIRRLRLEAAGRDDTRWLATRLSEHGPLAFHAAGSARLAARPAGVGTIQR